MKNIFFQKITWKEFSKFFFWIFTYKPQNRLSNFHRNKKLKCISTTVFIRSLGIWSTCVHTFWTLVKTKLMINTWIANESDLAEKNDLIYKIFLHWITLFEKVFAYNLCTVLWVFSFHHKYVFLLFYWFLLFLIHFTFVLKELG